jgi:mevalonate kinase
MPDFTATAPGKIILFGEHAVVYGRPAIAVPVTQVRVRATVQAAPRQAPGSLHIQAPEVGLDAELSEMEPRNPIATVVSLLLEKLNIERLPAAKLKISSTIPVAAGLGSGAAVSIAVLRALGAFLGRPMDDQVVSELAYEVEKLHHGTPFGIDNTVITYARPVYFVRGKAIQTMKVGRPFTMVIGDTGIASPTSAAVGDVRQAWQKNKKLYEDYFEAIGSLVDSAHQMIEIGLLEPLGPLMDANHGLLRKIGVSCEELDCLVKAAREAGAWGAKLSGGGRGGNMIAIATAEKAPMVAKALEKAGAVRTIITQVK